MRIKNHIAFRADSVPLLFHYLQIHHIPISQGSILSSFDIMSDDPHWKDIKDILLQYNLNYLSETEYTPEELHAAKWLTVRSKWRYGYPQPEGSFGYRSFSYTEKYFCPTCGNGLEQVNSFCMKKSPNWGKRHFVMLNWIEDELFINDISRAALTSSNLSGFEIRSVLDKHGRNELTNIYQLEVTKKLHPGILPDRPSIDEIFFCTSCGANKYHPTGIGMLAYHKEAFADATDIVKTSELFGWGKSASSRIIISEKMYRFIIQYNLAQSLVFEPIELV